MDKQRDDDGIWMFPDKMQGDIESGIDGAISETGKSKGWYSNKINQNFDKLSPYLEENYCTPSGRKLGSSGRRELIKAFCLDDQESFNAIVQ